MRRREFIALLVGAASTWPLAGRAQRAAGKQPTIGVLGGDATLWSPYTAAFVERLRELGWVEGRNIVIEYRWSEGRPERATEIAAELVRQNVDVIVTTGTAVSTLKQATTSIPIVFATATDPVGSGFVKSLAQPGGNVTGMSNQGADIASKRLEFLRQVVSPLRRLALLFDAGYSGAVLEKDEVQATARALHLEVASYGVRRAEDINSVFEALKDQADALYIVEDTFLNTNSRRIGTFALSLRLPTICNARTIVEAGGLMSYGPNFPALFRRTADFVDKILRGAKPGNMPVEQPTKFDLVVNLTTAKALGLTIPESFLSLADEVIE
jgi:putative ABC transport system substrate-binding protein